MTEPDFWNDNIAAQKTSQELNELKMKYETFNNMKELSDETELYLEMLEEDDSVQEELEETLEKLDKIMTSYEITLLLSEPYDHNAGTYGVTFLPSPELQFHQILDEFQEWHCYGHMAQTKATSSRNLS